MGRHLGGGHRPHRALLPAVLMPAAPTEEGTSKPRLRGRLHQVAFFASVPAGAALIRAAPTTTARVAAVVYALSLAAQFGVSAAYHRGRWSPPALRWMKRLDHSMIFLLIAGTYTPFGLLVLKGAWSVAILTIVWVGAAVGVALKMVRVDGLAVVTGVLYIALGWLAVVALPEIARGLPRPGIGLLLAGGVLYTAGAAVLARRRPDPNPATFGYHEVWHSMVIGGALCHYVVIALVFRAVG